MKIKDTLIEDTFAEAFTMRYTRLIVTAVSPRWVDAAVTSFCGYGSSIIACDAEAGLEISLGDHQTFDGRAGAAILAFGFSANALSKAVANRAGQCLMTCATTAVFDGLPVDPQLPPLYPSSAASTAPEVGRIDLGSHLRYFGDGYQMSKLLGERRFWRIPVMDGEFICEESCGIGKGVAGGNFLIQSVDSATGLVAAERAVDAIADLPNVITPFPGGVVRSGSKVGSKYPALKASTSHQFCPTLRGRVDSLVHPEATCVYEIVIDGTDFASVADAIRIGIHAAIGSGSRDGIVAISAGNYGGKLGKHHFRLHELLNADSSQ